MAIVTENALFLRAQRKLYRQDGLTLYRVAERHSWRPELARYMTRTASNLPGYFWSDDIVDLARAVGVLRDGETVAA